MLSLDLVNGIAEKCAGIVLMIYSDIIHQFVQFL